jgi:sugar lactone lactonase YvrE
MTQFVFTEILGGRVLRIDDLDESSLESVGDTVLAGPCGPSFNANWGVLVADPIVHEIALAEPGSGWTRFGTQGSGDGEFMRPAATEFLGSGRLVVVDSGNGRLVFIDDIAGSGWTTYGHRGLVPSEGGFADPRGVAVDTADRIWVSDPGANRLTRIDAPDGSGWKEIALPAAASPPLPYGLAAHQDGVVVIDVGNSRLLVLDKTGAPSATVDLADGTWVSPAFVTSLGDSLVIADVVANELRLLEPDGAGYTVTARLRGSPPDLLEPRFDSLGGVAS